MHGCKPYGNHLHWNVKQYEIKDKYGQVTNATFMSTKPKGVNLSRLLTYSSQETVTLQLSKIEASARSQHLLAGAHDVSGPGNVEILQFPRCFYSNTCCWTVAVFVLQKCQTKRTFNMRHHKNTLFLPEEKLESLGHKAITETALEQPLRASQHFIPPQKWFPQVPPTSSFLGEGFKNKCCLNVTEVSVDIARDSRPPAKDPAPTTQHTQNYIQTYIQNRADTYLQAYLQKYIQAYSQAYPKAYT